MSFSKFMNSFYGKLFFGFFIGFSAIVLGIYVGHAIIGTDGPQRLTEEQMANSFDSLDERYVNFNAGDLFPMENCFDADGLETNFGDIIDGKPTIFIFLSTTCGPCIDLIEYWSASVSEMLKSEVQVFACLRQGKGPIPEDVENLFSEYQILYFDGQYWDITYDMSFWPTVVCVDGSGFVKYIQFGFENKIEPPIARYYFK